MLHLFIFFGKNTKDKLFDTNYLVDIIWNIVLLTEQREISWNYQNEKLTFTKIYLQTNKFLIIKDEVPLFRNILSNQTQMNVPLNKVTTFTDLKQLFC